MSSINGKSLSKSYFTCLGKLRYCSEKMTDLVNNAANTSVIHYESAFTQVRDICQETATLVAHQAQSLANLKIQELLNISNELYNVSEQNVLIEHDPAKRPEKFSEGQIKYLIHIGPCQPKLSSYPKNTELAMKGKQSSFSPTWYKEYPYLEYSISSDKAYCYVCQMFGKGCAGRERSELPWITGINDWFKMKGSRGKDKAGKLETHFSSEVYAAALRDYSHFVCEDKHVGKLLTKAQREGLIDDESQSCNNQEVVKMLSDVVKVLTRNGLALCGCESSPNHSDGNFREIVYLLSRHNPVMKSWLEKRSSRKYQTTYMSPQSQNEFIILQGEEIRGIISDKVNQSAFFSVMADTTTPDVSHSDELSVAVRFVDSETLEPEERLVRVSETNDKTDDGQAKDIVKSLQISNIPLSTIQFQTYDSTASMSGVHNGAQQKLNKILERKIPYTKCVPHGLNLVIKHGCEATTLISKVYNVLEQLFVFFSLKAPNETKS